jgi:DNA methylase
MSTPRIYKTKVLSNAERQRRHRAKVKRERIQAEANARQARSAARPIEESMLLLTGDCREELADIPDDSIPLILTDPPYGADADPLYEWLAQFAARKLIPGGSLICLTGTSRLDRDHATFSRHLRYWHQHVMGHTSRTPLWGKHMLPMHKTFLHYVKGYYHKVHASPMPDVWVSLRDKSLHGWGQGTGGVEVPIKHVTLPGEVIVDPFAGSAEWGRIAHRLGRYWIGVDIVQGGTTTIAA